jgi:hypothetical protein
VAWEDDGGHGQVEGVIFNCWGKSWQQRIALRHWTFRLRIGH